MDLANYEIYVDVIYTSASLLEVADQDDGEAPEWLVLLVRSSDPQVFVNAHQETLSDHGLLIYNEQAAILQPQLQLELIDVVLSLLIYWDREQSMKSLASNEKGSAPSVGSCLYEILSHSDCLAIETESVQPVAFPYGEMLI